MQTNGIFKKLGLTSTATNIYLCLLQNGPASIAEISKRTSLYRPAIYAHLPELFKFGLISQSPLGKRTLYVAESPKAFSQAIEKLQDELSTILPALQEQFEHGGPKPVIRYFQGRKGIAQLYEILLTGTKHGDIIYRYESPKDYKKNARYYPKLYWDLATRRSPTGKSQIQKFVISNAKTERERSPHLERYTKVVPEKFDPFDYDITQIVLRSKVAFIDYQAETGSLIESPAFANFQRQIFKLLFNKL